MRKSTLLWGKLGESLDHRAIDYLSQGWGLKASQMRHKSVQSHPPLCVLALASTEAKIPWSEAWPSLSFQLGLNSSFNGNPTQKTGWAYLENFSCRKMSTYLYLHEPTCSITWFTKVSQLHPGILSFTEMNIKWIDLFISKEVILNEIHTNNTLVANRQEPIKSYHHCTTTRLIQSSIKSNQTIPSNLKTKPKILVSRPLQHNQSGSTCCTRMVNIQCSLDWNYQFEIHYGSSKSNSHSSFL